MTYQASMYTDEAAELSDRIEQIEISIEEAKRLVQMKNDLDKLTRNREFKKIFLDGYFKDEAARLALLMNEPNLPTEQRVFVERDLMGPGAIQRYLRTMNQRGLMAEQELEGLQEEGDTLRNEALEDTDPDGDGEFETI